MAIWEQPQILSGTSPQVMTGDQKPTLGICTLHQSIVSTEWAIRTAHIFMELQKQKISFMYMFNRNQPYDTAREQTTRASLERGAKYLFHYDSDVLIPANAIPLLIEWSEKFKLPLLSGVYWAKKPGTPMPCAWLKVGEKPEENRVEFMPIDIKPHMQSQAIVPADVVGAGCLLINTEVFKKLDESDPKKPYFQWGLGRNDINGKPLPQMSEDFYFCTRCVKELNIRPHVATAILCDHEARVIRRASDGEFELPMRI